MEPYISQAGLSAIMWVGVGLSALFVAIRTHVQYRKNKRLFINDHFIFFAMTLHLATAIVYQIAIPPMYMVKYFDYRTQPMTESFMDRASFFLQLQFALDFLLWTTLWAVKFSLLFFFWRLFELIQTSVRIFWLVMCGITASTWITLVVLQNFACDPLSDFFTLGKCGTDRDIYYSNLVFKFSVGTDIAGDIFIMLIPFPLLRKLHVNLRRRWLLGGLFSLPIIPIIFAILRLVMANPTKGNVDPVKFQLYSMLENSFAIITSCLPALRLFLVNSRETAYNRSGPLRYYTHDNGNYFNATVHGSYPVGRHGDSLLMETRIQTNHIHSCDADTDRTFLNDNKEEFVHEMHPPRGVVVTREFTVK